MTPNQNFGDAKETEHHHLNNKIRLEYVSNIDGSDNFPSREQADDGVPSVPEREEVEMPGRPLSYAQKALWLWYQLAPETGAYNTGVALRVRSAIDPDALADAVTRTAQRHELVRTTFDQVNGEPTAFLVDHSPVELVVRDLPHATEDELHRVVGAELNAPFQLTDAGAFRFVLVRRGECDAVFLVAGHHIATDATSNGLLMRDLLDAHELRTRGHARSLPSLSASYADYVASEAQLLSSARGQRLVRYWREVCEGGLAAELPTDRPRSGLAAIGATHHVQFSGELLGSLRHTARACGVSLFSYLLAVFQALIQHYTQQNDFLIGCPSTTRLRPSLRAVVGNFVNTLVFRAHFTPATTLRDAALAVDRQVRSGMAAVGYPFALLTRTANRPRTRAGASLCNITFNLIGSANPDPLSRLLLDCEGGPATSYAGLRLAPFELPQAEGQLDLSVNVRESTDSLVIDFRYSTQVFDAATIERFAGCFARAMKVAVAEPTVLVTAHAIGSPGADDHG
jgi:hypothetical protein